MEFHELSDLMPFREEQVDAIEMRMRQNGWKPGSVITLFEGKILDGRHRYLAAERVGIEPVYVEYQGDKEYSAAADFVAVENFESRHTNLEEKNQFLTKMLSFKYWILLPKGSSSKNTKRKSTEKTAIEIATFLAVGRKTVQLWAKNGLRYKDNAQVRQRIRETANPDVVMAMECGDITTKDAIILAELPEERQVEVLQEILANPQKPIRADTSGNDEWYTPVKYIDLAREVMGGIDVDPAGCEISQKVIKAPVVYTIEDSGLDHSWKGRIWLNPPYSKGLIDQFVAKLREEYTLGHVEQAIVLTHNFTDTAWFHALATDASAMCFTRGRIRFYTVDGVGNSPTSGHVFFYFGDCTDAFVEKFTSIGFCCAPRNP